MGLGAGMAAGLAQAGAHVIINSRKADACAAVAKKIQSMGCKATAMAFDVTDEKSVVKAVKKIVKQLGTIDILVNNAGSTRRSPFLESSTVRTGRAALSVKRRRDVCRLCKSMLPCPVTQPMSRVH